jgi:GAF domain-containing protein
MELSETACVVPLIVRRVIMKGSTAGFAERLFGSQNQIAIMDHLAEWTRLHLDARFASAQLYDHKRKRLRVVAQREFAPGLQFGEIPITSGTVCARAARLQMPILIPDVTRDEDWIPFLSFSESAGFGGVLSIPLLSRAGNLIGVTSCHFSGHAKPTKTGMNFVRASCEFASDAIIEIRRMAAL